MKVRTRDVKPLVRIENDGAITVRIGRNRAAFPVIENPGRGADKRAPGERAADYVKGIVPTFSGKRMRGMMSATFRMTAETAREHAAANRLASKDSSDRKAVEYAQWLARRDCIDIGADSGQVRWAWFAGSKRARAVSLATVSILIPNWDFEPVMTEETFTELREDPCPAPVKIPRAVFSTSSLTRIGKPLPVAPSCVLQVAA